MRSLIHCLQDFCQDRSSQPLRRNPYSDCFSPSIAYAGEALLVSSVEYFGSVTAESLRRLLERLQNT